MNKSVLDWQKSLAQDPQYWAEHTKLDFAYALDRMLHQRGMTRTAMADALGSSPAYITKIMRGDANLTIETMAKLALAIGGRVHVHISDADNRVRWIESLAAKGQRESVDPASKVWANCTREGKCHGIAIAA